MDDSGRVMHLSSFQAEPALSSPVAKHLWTRRYMQVHVIHNVDTCGSVGYIWGVEWRYMLSWHMSYLNVVLWATSRLPMANAFESEARAAPKAKLPKWWGPWRPRGQSEHTELSSCRCSMGRCTKWGQYKQQPQGLVALSGSVYRPGDSRNLPKTLEKLLAIS